MTALLVPCHILQVVVVAAVACTAVDAAGDNPFASSC